MLGRRGENVVIVATIGQYYTTLWCSHEPAPDGSTAGAIINTNEKVNT